MLNWPQLAILEKNKLASDAPFLVLLKLSYEGLSEPVCLARNTEDVTWNGIVWEAYPMNFGTNTVDGQEEPSLQVTVSNAGGLLQKYLQEHQGFGGAEVSIYIVHASYLDNTTPLDEFNFQIGNTSYDEQWITFKLTSSSEIVNRFPFATYAAHYCPYKFKSVRCGYNGLATGCNNTADSCLIPSRFGGEEGMNSV
jgi:phage-related protein